MLDAVVKFGRKLKPEIDHIVSLKKGGTNDLTNLQLLCRFCNCSKQIWTKPIGGEGSEGSCFRSPCCLSAEPW